MSESIDLELLNGFISETKDGLSGIEEKLILLESNASDSANMDALFRIIHSIKGTSAFFGLESMKFVSHKMENVLDEIRQGKCLPTPALVTLLLKGVDLLNISIAQAEAESKGREPSEEEKQYVVELEEERNKKSEISGDSKGTDSSLHAKSGAQSKSTKKSMRIDEETVDGFMKYIGELITASDTFNYIYRKLEQERMNSNTAKEFKNALVAFNSLSNQLQKSLMDIRRVPVKSLFGKAPRLVRDLSASLGKKIELNLIGEDCAIDKSLLEILEDPLVHMVRNSLDHGIESIERRKEVGKAESGTITIEAKADKSFFYLNISDDGAGIDPVKIRQLAVKKNLLTAEDAQKLTDGEALNLIFMPGFSSAEVVSEVSGRGVGMDVVMTNIKSANGSVSVESQVGKGTKITIKLPLTVTLTVIGGLVLLVGKTQYVLPLDAVAEVSRLNSGGMHTIAGQTPMYRFRDKVVPVFELRELFGEERVSDQADRDSLVTILIKSQIGYSCLIADKLLGIQQVVVRNIGDAFSRARLVCGGVIMGDGRVGLLLDVNGVTSGVKVSRAKQLTEESIDQKGQEVPKPTNEKSGEKSAA